MQGGEEVLLATATDLSGNACLVPTPYNRELHTPTCVTGGQHKTFMFIILLLRQFLLGMCPRFNLNLAYLQIKASISFTCAFLLS